jgi:DUF4097 and DUF4098 domain-containing protein YvlB
MSLLIQRIPVRAGRFAALPLVASLSFTAACDIALSGAREEATETITRSFPLTTGGTVDIATTNGPIEVTAGSGATVEVKAVKVARSATKDGAADLLKKIEIKEEITPSLVKLRSERRGSGGGPTLSGWGQSVEVRYYVQVPANAKVVLSTVNGHIEVTDVKAAANLETVNGAITGRGLGGEIKASTVNGGVKIALTDLTADVNVATTNGGVTVQLPADAKALLVGRTTNGGLDVDGLQVEEVERSRRRLEARLNGGGRRVEVETTNGGINFRRS